MNLSITSPIARASVVALLLSSIIAGKTAEFENNLGKVFAVKPGGKFVLDADRGMCQVETAETDKVEVRVMRKAKNGTKAQADELFANHEVTFDQSGDTVTVQAKDKKRRSWTFRSNPPYLEVQYLVKIPKRFDVDLKTAGGDIRMDALHGKAKVRTSSGGIQLQDVTGSVEANDSGGNIDAGEVGGEFTARTSSGSIKVKKVSGKADFSNSGGDIQASEMAGSVSARTSSGSIRLGTVHGELNASNSGGDITVENAGGNLSADTSSSSINLGQLHGKSVNVKNSGGNIAIESADGAVSARTSSGTIRIKTVKGAADLKNSGGDISIGNAGDIVRAETSSGAIRIEAVHGLVEARNSGGDIHIGEANNRVAARTSSGSIVIKLAKARVEAADSGGSIELKEARAAVQATTSSGQISVAMNGHPAEECRLEVSGGGITLKLPKSAAFNLDARSSGGTVKSQIPVDQIEQGKPRSGALAGKLNGGGPALVLRSSSGDIEIKASAEEAVKVEDDAK